MSRPEVASEPSMDDILASIRKIIAEEPAAVRPPPEPRVNALDARSSAGASPSAAKAAAQPAQPFGQPQRQPDAAPAQTAPVQSAAVQAAQPLSATSPQAEPSATPLTANSLARALSGLSTAPASVPAPANVATSDPAAVLATPLDDLADLLEEAPASPLRPSLSPAGASAAPSAPATAAMAAGSRLFAKPAPAPTPAAPTTAAPASSPSFGSAFGTAFAAKPDDRASTTASARSTEAPRSFDELLRSRPGTGTAPGTTPAKAELDVAKPSAKLGDLGSVVPGRAGFDAPRIEPMAAPAASTPPLGEPDPFSWSGPKFGEKAGTGLADPQATMSIAAAPTVPRTASASRVAESPPFGASVLKGAGPVADNSAAPSSAMSQPAPSPAGTDEPARYEVIAAMPGPALGLKSGAAPANALPPLAAKLAAPMSATISGPAAAALAEPAPSVGAEPELELPELELNDAVIDPAFELATDGSEAGFEAAAIESTAAAASALGALAAGLAASSKSMMPPLAAPVTEREPAPEPGPALSSETAPAKAAVRALPSFEASLASMTAPAAPKITPAPTVTAVEQNSLPVAVSAPVAAPVAPAPVAVAAVDVEPASSVAPGSGVSPLAPGSGAGPVRSLDDTVADLLRPMLRQWLSDNMPRIVEKALRIEVAEGVRSVVPPPKAD